VGDYVANAVLCFALNEDVPIVDMNVRRVVGRYFDWEKLKDFEIENKLSELIPRAMSKQFNWAIIDFSALICSRKPKHDICFLTDLCEHFQRLHADR
jgi:A/G-specific adenine glycosylase